MNDHGEAGMLDLPSRFWTKFDKGDGCWEWKTGKFTQGYGCFKLNGKDRKAHILSLEWHAGPHPPDKPHALHSCDNPPCVNPAHLRWGSHQENMDDKIARGRHGNTKISAEDAKDIRNKYKAGGVSQKALASEYGLSQQHISDIVRRKRRKYD